MGMEKVRQKVAYIAQPEYFRMTYQDTLLSDHYISEEFPFHYDMEESDFNKLIEFQADVNFFFRGEFVPEAVLNNIKGLKVCISTEPFPRKINGEWHYTMDSIKRYIDFRNKIINKKFDYVFHYDKRSIELFELDGIQISGEFILPVSTNSLNIQNLPKKWDGFFLGRSTAHREDLLSVLKHRYNFLHIAHGLTESRDISHYVSKSTINFNIHAENEITWEPRVQMLLASKAFVLSEKLPNNLYLQPGEDYIEFSDKHDLIDKFEYYLKRPNKRREITEHGYQTVKNKLNSQDRFNGLISIIHNSNTKQFNIQKQNRIVNLLSTLVK